MILKTLTDAMQRKLDKFYHNERYIVQQKAFVFVCLIVLLLFIEIISLAFNTYSIRQSTPAVMVFFNLIFIVLGILFLVLTFTGHFKIASNLSCIFFFAVMMKNHNPGVFQVFINDTDGIDLFLEFFIFCLQATDAPDHHFNLYTCLSCLF